MPRAEVPEHLKHRPFTTAEAAALGISKSALRRKKWRQLLRGVWVYRDVPDSRELRLAAVRLLLADGTFICGLTAAWVHGIEVIHPDLDRIWIGCLAGRRLRNRPGCIVQQIGVEDGDLVVLDGALITSPLRTAYDCARLLPLVEGVVVADALSHSGHFTEEEFAAFVADRRGARGVRTADRVADLMDAKSESPMETRVRVLLVLEGLPRPKCQHEVLEAGDEFVARIDLAYPGFRVAIEYDGAWHFKQRRADDRRRDRVRDLDWKVIVVSAEDYFRMPWAIVAKVRNALADAGMSFAS